MRVQAGARGRAAALAAAGRGGNTTLDAARAVEIFLAKRRHKKRYGVQQLQQLKKTHSAAASAAAALAGPGRWC